MSESKTKVIFLESANILVRIADCDKTAIDECLEVYGNLVWDLTKKYTANEAEAEIAVQEVFPTFGNMPSDSTRRKTTKRHLFHLLPAAI